MFVDIHNPRMEGFFTYPSTRPIPMLNVQPHQLAVRYLKKKDLVNPVVSNAKRCTSLFLLQTVVKGG